jgi:hypothetical protein
MAYDRAFIAKVIDIFETVVDEEFAFVYDDRMYAITNTSSEYVFPYCIYQSQDGGGKLEDYVGQNGWNGLMTFRSIDITKSGAMNKLIELANVIATNSGIFHKLGYSVGIELDKPQLFPIEQSSEHTIYTIGIVTLVRVYSDT